MDAKRLFDATITDLADFAQSQPLIPERRDRARGGEYRTIWISDVHLGTRGCNAEMLIDFLDHVDSETMYLVGDIVDGWRLKKKFYWPAAHNDVVWRILKRAKRGTRIVYIPGQSRRDVPAIFRASISAGWRSGATRSTKPPTAGGCSILHGDEFDVITLAHRWLAYVGDAAYGALMRLNVAINAVRRRARSALLVAVEACQGQGEERGRVHLALRGGCGACGRDRAASTAWCAGTSIPPRCARSPASDIITTATGWRAAPHLVEHGDGRMELLHWADEIAARANGSAPPAGGLSRGAHRDRHRRLGTAGQRRGAHAGGDADASSKKIGHRVLVIAPDRFASVACPTYP